MYTFISFIMEKKIITGERIQQLADIYIGKQDDFEYNPLIWNQSNKHVNLDSLIAEYDNPSILFCYPHHIHSFSQKINNFKNPFILITHNSDENIVNSDTILTILDNPNVKKWYAQNICFKHEKLYYLPIGMANSMWTHGNLDFFKNVNDLFIKSKKVYFNFNMNTNYNKRNECYHSLKDKLTFLDIISPELNLKRLSEYEFCICPEGNGVDTHRLWECFYLKTVPIVKNSVFIQILKEHNLPLVILENWDDYDENTLMYEDYNFDNLRIFMTDIIDDIDRSLQ